MIFVGNQLGLFKAMAGAGPLSAEDLAARTGLHPRRLLEWMRLQAAGRGLFYRGDDCKQLHGLAFTGATGRIDAIVQDRDRQDL